MVVSRRTGSPGSRRRAFSLPPTILLGSSVAAGSLSVANAFEAAYVVAFSVGGCSLAVTVFAESGVGGRGGLQAGMRSVGTFLGVAAALVAAVLLGIRFLQIGLEVVQHYPTRFSGSEPFSISGVWALVFVLVAFSLRVVVGRERRLVAPLFWLVVLTTGWVCASPAALTPSMGGFERANVTLFLLAGMSGALVVTVLCGEIGRYRDRLRLAGEDPDVLLGARTKMPGLGSSCTCLAIAVGFLILFHLLVPVRTLGSYRVTLLITAVCAVGGSLSCFVMCDRSWSGGLGEAGFGLSTLALATLATLLVPSHAGPLVDRYPQLFNAMIVGFAVATGGWTWLSQVWEQQLTDGEARTTTGRLIPYVKRFAFFSAALAYLSGTLMAFWPRLPGIATMDHSYGRVISGFSANLFLLLVMLWASRRLRRATFHVLTVLVVMSGAGFMLVRMLPFASDAN